jgi:AcrR family transcriptional regulator
MPASATTPRIRDADRSRVAILEAAETLFAERGFDGASLGDIAAAAGLSRGTPSYFYGSKEQLYRAVLSRVFEEREQATAAAFEPLMAWTAAEDARASLDTVLRKAVEGYMAFLLARPAFVRLVEWEELTGGRRLREAPRRSRAIGDAFTALRGVARRRGLRIFRVDDAVVLFVSLTFSPIAQRSTFMASVGRDLEDPATMRRHVKLVVAQLVAFVAGERRA